MIAVKLYQLKNDEHFIWKLYKNCQELGFLDKKNPEESYFW